MPYYIYRISDSPIRRLEQLERHDAWRDASAGAKKLRAGLAQDDARRIRVIFGETELHAEDALNQLREPEPEPDD